VTGRKRDHQLLGRGLRAWQACRCARAADRTAQAKALLRQAHQISQQIGAAEASDVLAELNARTKLRPEG
jgi:hypothetical protein